MFSNQGYHEGLAELVEVRADGLVGEPHRPPEFRRVPELTVDVGEHGPKSPHRRGGHPDPKLRQVAFQKCPNKALPPGDTRLFGGCEERPGKPSAEPEPFIRVGSDLGEVEPVEVDVFDPARE